MPNELDSGSSLPHVHRDATKTVSSFSGALPGVYRGIIVSRDDPDKQGRVKVALPQIYGDVPVDELPWVYPITSAWNVAASDSNGGSGSGGSGASAGAASVSASANALNAAPRATNGSTASGGAGGSNGSKPTGGTVNVPPLGAPVVVQFEGGDHRYPMYIGGSFGKPGFTDTVPEHSFAKNGNSPDNYSFTSPGGTKIQCDDRAGTQKVIAIDPKGNYVSIAQSGLIEVKSKDTVSIKGASLVSMDCDSAVQIRGNKVLIYSTGDLVIEASGTINVNGGSTVNIQSGGAINLNCGSSSTATPPFKEIQTDPNFDGK
jgi:hypothetical protein